MFIELHEKNGNRIMFNVNQIKNIYELPGQAMIDYSSKMENSIIVEENYDEVRKMISETVK